MTGFLGRLQVDYGDWTDTGNGRIGILLSPVTWTCTRPGYETVVTIGARFMSDGASSPRFLWWFLPPWGDRTTLAALLHDFICDELKDGRPLPGCDARAKCDYQFYLALRALGLGEIRARAAWLGVRSYSIFVARLG